MTAQALLAAGGSAAGTIILSAVVFALSAAAAYIGLPALRQFIIRQEQQYEAILRGNLLLEVRIGAVTVLAGMAMVVLGMFGYAVTRSMLGATIFGCAGLALPAGLLKLLKMRRLRKLEEQLPAGVQTLASGVRAGLNLVQALQLIARDGPVPMNQEFTHLLREYEYGVPLESAMENAAVRIGSGDYRLLFAALQTHRERGGDLGVTLDRIGASIREIQRLENRIRTLTAQGRANARFLGMLVIVVLVILYVIDPTGIRTLFADDIGKLLLAGIATLNIAGFLWIKKIVSIDI